MASDLSWEESKSLSRIYELKLDNPELVEHLSDALFKWNTPDNPYFVILGRGDWTNPDDVDADPYAPIARAIVAALKERGQ